MRWRAELINVGLGYCISHQSTPFDAAYLLLAEGDEAFFEKYIDSSVFRPVYIPAGKESNPGLRKALSRDGFGSDVLLSRVDSDDLITADYVERLSRAALESGMPDQWFVAVDGQRSDLRQVQSFHYVNSPFISRFVKNRTSESIFRNHQNVTELQPILLEGVLWWQLLHGSNLANKFWKPRPLEKQVRGKSYSGGLSEFQFDEFNRLFGFDASKLIGVLGREECQ
ncbi:hypothetical protein CLV29_2984 [Naumannella halotolerans]|uniref:Glycosyl transferase family 2 n=2 Tax=Naumannella halotolerans TaxID=993414 RepID=A0A4R7IYU6_9ACTN|nr:hypothetical protein CLV29_2984 [Naumannella halotolerans]